MGLYVSHRAKKLLGTYVPERWMVEVTYRNGEAPSMFTIEALEDSCLRPKSQISDRH
jgi:hypothetical protein